MEKFPLMSFDREAEKRDLIGTLKSVIEQAVDEDWSFRRVMREIERDVGCLEDEIKYFNNIARDNIIRRELGLHADERISAKDAACVFNLFVEGGAPQE